MKLTKINEWLNPHKNNKPQWYIDLDVDGTTTEAVCYSEKILSFKVGDDIPADWTLAPGADGKKPMLKVPGEQGKGGFKALSFDERMDLDQFQQERMDRRTALMQAVASTEIPDRVLPKADQYYTWLRETVTEVRSETPESTQARGSGTEAGAVVPRDAVPASQLSAHKAEAGSVAGAVGDKGDGSSAPATAHTPKHTHTFTDQPFEYDGQPIPVRPGFEVCTKCLNGRRKGAA